MVFRVLISIVRVNIVKNNIMYSIINVKFCMKRSRAIIEYVWTFKTMDYRNRYAN